MSHAIKLAARLLFLVCLAWGAAAQATGTTANVSWLAPTQYTDGHTLVASDIASYTLSWSAQSPYATDGTVNALSTALFAQITNLSCGKYTFTMVVTTTAGSYGAGAASAPSAPVTYDTGIACAAPAPKSVTLTIK